MSDLERKWASQLRHLHTQSCFEEGMDAGEESTPFGAGADALESVTALRAENDRLNEELAACTTVPAGCGYWKERSALQAAENERLRGALTEIDHGYGPNHLSKFARDTARAALKKE